MSTTRPLGGKRGHRGAVKVPGARCIRTKIGHQQPPDGTQNRRRGPSRRCWRDSDFRAFPRGIGADLTRRKTTPQISDFEKECRPFFVNFLRFLRLRSSRPPWVPRNGSRPGTGLCDPRERSGTAPAPATRPPSSCICTWTWEGSASGCQPRTEEADLTFSALHRRAGPNAQMGLGRARPP